MTKPKIFIVDDDRTTASVMKLYLEEFGYRVSAIATNAIDAIEIATDKKPDLVLMDIKLGKGLDGIDAAEVISKHLGIPIIFITAYADEPTLERAKLLEPAGFINKPLREKDLQTTIELALSKVNKSKSDKHKKSTTSVEDTLEGIYNLTPAEARVAAKLVEYPQLKLVAQELNISISTAKTHLKHIFRKTHTNRQTILVHKIVTGPAGLMLKVKNES
jgi:DNA-binding NarL/FixJ family response regulator